MADTQTTRGMNMNIDKVVFTVTEMRIYTITASAKNGWDMPDTPNELIEMVNNVKNDPRSPMKDDETELDTEIVSISSDIIESK